MHIHMSVTKLQKMVQDPRFGYPGTEGIQISVLSLSLSLSHTHTHCLNTVQ